MIEFVRRMLMGQFEASLAMLGQCVEMCPAAHWNGTIVKYEFWHVAYYTLYCTDLYLAESWDAFEPCEFLPAGKNELEREYPSREMTREELLGYLALCRQRAVDALAAETAESLARPAGFERLAFSRGELYLSSMRHVMHHTGQLSALLRKLGVDTDWVKMGWR